MRRETAFSIDVSSIKYGPGVTREVGYEMRRLGAKRVMVFTDPNMAGSEPVAITLDSLRVEGIDAVLFDQVRVEPTDASFKEAIRAATEGHFEGYFINGRRPRTRDCGPRTRAPTPSAMCGRSGLR